MVHTLQCICSWYTHYSVDTMVHSLKVLFLSNVYQMFDLLCIKTQYQSVWCQIDAHDILGTTMLNIMVIDGNH